MLQAQGRGPIPYRVTLHCSKLEKMDNEQLAATIAQLATVVEHLVEHQQRTQIHLDRIDSQIERTQEQLERMVRKVEELAESSKEANERINILFQVVDGIIRRLPPEQPPPV